MRTYKILHIIGGGEIGGAEQHVLSLLKGINRERFAPHLACLINGPFADLALENKISTQTFSMRHPLDLSPLPSLIRWARRKEIDLVHTHGSRANLLGRLGAKWLGIPTLTTVHSSLAHDYRSPLSASIALALDRLTLPLTSGIITVSEYLAEEVASRGGKNLITIYNGQAPISFAARNSSRQQFRTQWRIPADALVLGTIGRLHPTKGQSHLIKAATLLHSTFPNLHLLLIGEGPLRQELELELQHLALPYTLTGYLPKAHETLPAMDLFVLPSVSEGMGLVLLEAMQAGVPIVATAVGGIPEVIRAGKDGLLVPSGDVNGLAQACASIIENPNLAKSLVLSGQDRWQIFSLETMFRETEQVYTCILDKATRSVGSSRNTK
ncbi:glycosyltransferase [Desulfosporosinus metallidurans]|uniref:Poly(Glycerol-phosphate) alpha-glucosyltransferase n=1 Tax=Desulfosporosinus metallidurans TaxID=1888891 RepID=A0A1Q8R2W8_9FIRM|nr:glycosyltransferase [Desulfosporosinus metallidurans]OLN33924.1 Poly(glycerol-phosphate) alpha-glucosyltransferase [Desulfosporosinus metallidurans]